MGGNVLELAEKGGRHAHVAATKGGGLWGLLDGRGQRRRLAGKVQVKLGMMGVWVESKMVQVQVI